TAQSRPCQRAPEPVCSGFDSVDSRHPTFSHSLCAVRTLCTAIVVGLWRLALRRLCGKGHDFVWSDAIQDAHFPWLSEGIRLLPEVFLGQTVHMRLGTVRGNRDDVAPDLEIPVWIVRISYAQSHGGVAPHHTIFQPALGRIEQDVCPVIVTPDGVD